MRPHIATAWLVGGVALLAALLRAETHTVAALGVAAAIGYLAWLEVGKNAVDTSSAVAITDATAAKRLATQPFVSAPPLPQLVRFPKQGMKFLKLNPDLVALVQQLRFVSTFDKPRFEEWILAMNHLQKVYVYILGGRYDATSYIDTFNDLRDQILETMSGFVVAVPAQFKHIYGVDPDKTCADGLMAFRSASDQMAWVLTNYSKHDLRLPRTVPAPNEPVAANRLVRPGRENVVP